jgi:hypothetical protein
MELHAVPMPRQRNIAAVLIHARCGEHMGAVHRNALRLVDRRGIAVIDMGIVFEIERNGPARVETHAHGVRADLFDGADAAILYIERTVIA